MKNPKLHRQQGFGEQRGQVPGRHMELPPLGQPRPGARLQGGLVQAAAAGLAVPGRDPDARPLELQRRHAELDRARLCRVGVVRPDLLRTQAVERVRHGGLPAVRQRALLGQGVAQRRHGDRARRGSPAVRGQRHETLEVIVDLSLHKKVAQLDIILKYRTQVRRAQPPHRRGEQHADRVEHPAGELGVEEGVGHVPRRLLHPRVQL